MQMHPTLESSSHPVASGLRAPRLQSMAWAVVGLVSLVSAFGLTPAGSTDDRLSDELAAFEQRVLADPAPTGSATEVLARRYLDTLPPELRQHISDQVRAEQRTGRTPSGNDAFVLRRLELYEAALLQSRTIAAARAL